MVKLSFILPAFTQSWKRPEYGCCCSHKSKYKSNLAYFKQLYTEKMQETDKKQLVVEMYN